MTEYVIARLRIWETVSAERRLQKREEVGNGYAPAIQLINAIIESFPHSHGPRTQLREQFRRNSHLITKEDAENIWVAMSKSARLEDLIQARDLLELSMRSKTD